MKLLALIIGDRFWQPYSTLIRWILMARGIQVGKSLTVKGDIDIRTREAGKIRIGTNCRLDHNVRLVAANQATLKIGNGCRIALGTVMNAGTDITLGKKVLVSGYCYLQSSSHGTAPNTTIMDQPHTYAPVSIGDGAWLGSHVTVLPGVTIGPGAIIGSHAVVTKDIPANAIAVGIPAKIIRQR